MHDMDAIRREMKIAFTQLETLAFVKLADLLRPVSQYSGKFTVTDGNLYIDVNTERYDRQDLDHQAVEDALVSVQKALDKVGLASEITGGTVERTGAKVDTFSSLKATFEISADNVQKINQAKAELVIDFMAVSVKSELEHLVTHVDFGIAPQDRFGVMCRAANAIGTALTSADGPS